MNIEKGAVAVITGGGGGIGRALAIELAKKGCNLALVDINQKALEESLQSVEEFGVKTTLHTVNIMQFAAVEDLASEVLSEHGKVNILINNAGITLQKSFATHSLEDWQRVIGINLMGVIYGCKAFLEPLKKAGGDEGAHIVNLSSMAGFMGLPNQASYCATKAAVKALSESLHAELRVNGIGVTSVHPGAIKTNIILATLSESDNVKEAQKSQKLVDKIGNTAEYAAKKIVRGIEKDSLRVRVGKDSVILDILKRLFPSGLSKRVSAMSAKRKEK